MDVLPATVWPNVPDGFVSNAMDGLLLFSNFVSSGVSSRFYRFLDHALALAVTANW